MMLTGGLRLLRSQRLGRIVNSNTEKAAQVAAGFTHKLGEEIFLPLLDLLALLDPHSD